MTIRAVCPACQTRLKFHDDLAGLRGRCPRCRGTLLIPAGPPTWEPAGAPKVSTRFGLRSIGLLVGLAGVMAVGLALVSWIASRNPSDEPQAPPVRVVHQPVREVPAVIPPKPDTPPEPVWVDGRQGVVRDQVRVWVSDVKVESILIQGAIRPRLSDDPYLSIRLVITNLKKERILTYQGWGWVDPLEPDRPHASLEDRFGNDYPLVRFSDMVRINGQVNVERIHPGYHAIDVLIFEPPIDQADWLMLTLPGENVGQSGEFRLKVPRLMTQPRAIQPR